MREELKNQMNSLVNNLDPEFDQYFFFFKNKHKGLYKFKLQRSSLKYILEELVEQTKHTEDLMREIIASIDSDKLISKANKN